MITFIHSVKHQIPKKANIHFISEGIGIMKKFQQLRQIIKIKLILIWKRTI